MAAITAGETEIYGDETHSGWSHFAWGRSGETTSSTACIGTKALSDSPGQYQGMGFAADAETDEIDARAIHLRVYVDKPATITIIAAPLTPPRDIHEYFLAPDTAFAWKPGWTIVEFAIPASFGKTGQIIFEQQTNTNPIFIVDDIRLITR